MKKTLLVVVFCLSVIACNAPKKQKDIAINTEQRSYTIEKVVEDLSNPWGMTWLPDGSILITEKSGELIHFKDGLKTEIKNVPEIYNRGQGGLLDIKVHPAYATNGWIYFTYASSEGEGDGGHTKLSRAKLKDGDLTDIEDLYKATPNTTRGQHFGSRIEFDGKGYVYFSIGERGDRDTNPQDKTRDGGKIYRLHDDGRIPDDNPFVSEAGAKKAKMEGMEDPIYYWVPSIAPCGMTFVTGDTYPDWKGGLMVGSLKFNYVELLKLDSNKVTERIKVAEDIGRVRNVQQGPDGFIYIAVEGEGIVRIMPAS